MPPSNRKISLPILSSFPLFLPQEHITYMNKRTWKNYNLLIISKIKTILRDKKWEISVPKSL
ncbi:MAG: hypothetical protein CSB06_00240 [Bacteroidia bacterium]|nr:MAG: hypothetical protein CSB06_00240 [Bacteroidia bacterium]